MQYLHTRDIVHGRLKSNNCVVDDRWAVKISGQYRSVKGSFTMNESERETELVFFIFVVAQY